MQIVIGIVTNFKMLQRRIVPTTVPVGKQYRLRTVILVVNFYLTSTFRATAQLTNALDQDAINHQLSKATVSL